MSSYFRLRERLSYLPERVLRLLIRNWKLAEDPADGWTFWLDASYAKWCRSDSRSNHELDQ